MSSTNILGVRIIFFEEFSGCNKMKIRTGKKEEVPAPSPLSHLLGQVRMRGVENEKLT